MTVHYFFTFGPYPQRMNPLPLLAVAGLTAADIRQKNPPLLCKVINGAQPSLPRANR